MLNTNLEKFILLSIEPANGKIISSFFHYGLAGAILMDLELKDKIIIHEDIVYVKDATPTTSHVYDTIINVLSSSTKEQKVQYWLPRITRKIRSIQKEIFQELEKQQLIHIDHKKFLGFIPYTRYRVVKLTERENLIYALKKYILNYRLAADSELSILGLVSACRLDQLIALSKTELKSLRKGLNEIIVRDPIANPIHKSIKNVQIAASVL